MRWTTGLFLGFVLALAGRTATAGEQCYLLIFGSQSAPKILKYTHTWATAVRVVWDDANPARYTIEQHTLSWLPASLNVRVLALRPEKGVNLDLYQTLNFVLSQGEHVKLWGPFVMHPLLYRRALEGVGKLERGAVQYRAIDSSADIAVSDCIHAVADLDPMFGRGHYPLIRIGYTASRRLARQVVKRSISEQRQYNNLWLVPAPGVESLSDRGHPTLGDQTHRARSSDRGDALSAEDGQLSQPARVMRGDRGLLDSRCRMADDWRRMADIRHQSSAFSHPPSVISHPPSGSEVKETGPGGVILMKGR